MTGSDSTQIEKRRVVGTPFFFFFFFDLRFCFVFVLGLVKDYS